MHIVFSRHKLLSALKACQKVIPKSTFRSIFQCALLYSSPTFSGVRIEATDLNSGVSALDESAAVLETGSVVCPIRGVVRFLSNSKSMHSKEDQSRGHRVSWCSERGKTQTRIKAHKCWLSVNPKSVLFHRQWGGWLRNPHPLKNT